MVLGKLVIRMQMNEIGTTMSHYTQNSTQTSKEPGQLLSGDRRGSIILAWEFF